MKHKILSRLCSLVGALLIALSVTSCVKEPAKPNWDFIYIVDSSRTIELGKPSTIEVKHVGNSVSLENCTFVSDNEKVAVVKDFKVVPVALGKANITITYTPASQPSKKLSAVLSVEVVAPKPPKQ